MTYAPDTLRAARALLLEHLDIHPTGSYPADLDPAEVGIVGDTAHAAKGTSYHLGADQLTSTAYSRRTARDRAGLSNAASAVDVGEFRVVTPKGTFTQRDLAVWSVEQCQANHPDTRDIREIIYTDDGRRVLRYDRERGYTSEPRTGEADSSHLYHDHYSQYRDAEGRYTLRDHFARWLTHIGVIGDDMTPAELLGTRLGKSTTTVAIALQDTHTAVQAIQLQQAAILTAVKADADTAAILARIDARAAELRQAQADQLAAILAALPDDDEPVSREVLVAALTQVLGSLDGATPPAQG